DRGQSRQYGDPQHDVERGYRSVDNADEKERHADQCDDDCNAPYDAKKCHGDLAAIPGCRFEVSWVAGQTVLGSHSLAATRRLEDGRYYNGAAILRDHCEAYRCVRPNR